MAENVPTPTMNWSSSNLTESWTKFQQHVELMFTGPLKGKSEEEKISYLLIWVGEKGRDIYNTFQLSDDEKKKLEIHWTKFKGYVTPRSNEVFERYKFHARNQANETFDSFVTDLKLLVKSCGYNDADKMVRDKIVFGVSSSKIRERLINEGSTLTLAKAVEIGHSYEISRSQLQSMDRTVKTETEVNHVKEERFYNKCFFCGRGHVRGKCPAYGSTCNKCNKKNHWSQQCETATKHMSRRKQKGKAGRSQNSNSVHSVGIDDQYEEGQSEDECLEIYSLTSHSNNKKLTTNLRICNPRKAVLKAEVDSGAGASVMPTRCFRQLCPEYCTNGVPNPDCSILTPKPFTVLKTYTQSTIPQHGMLSLECKAGKETQIVDFYVCDTNGPILLGLNDSLKLKLIAFNDAVKQVTISVIQNELIDVSKNMTAIKNTADLIEQYPNSFKGLGKFKNKAKLVLKDNAQPVVAGPRRCPINLKQEIQKALDEMEKQGVISKIPQGQPTEWLSNLAYARKSNGKLRVCLDPRDLNLNIKRTYHRSPTVEEITHQLAGAKVFSKLDAKNGYWSIELDYESSLLTAFNSPASNQRYKFNRLAFGLKVAQDIFQEQMDLITRNLHGVISIADDIIVYGSDEKEHDTHLHNLMKAAHVHGLVLNPDKCFVKESEISFFGATYSANGVKPDKTRVQEIKDLPAPTNIQELQSLLGMVQYLSPFIPHLSTQTAPLRELLKKEAVFSWNASHTSAFQTIKKSISNASTLHYFNPKLETKIQVDASQKGLGAALIQIDPAAPESERVIAFASKSLTEVERRYANIEREFLAVVFGAEKFHTYIYGAKVLVESDHKPLETIQLKNLAQAPPRLQRMMIRLQQYDIQIKYRKGSELLLADFLSRYKPNASEHEIVLEQTVHAIKWSDEKLSLLRQQTKTDHTLSALTDIIINGWPAKCSDLPNSLKPYWTVKDYMSIDNGIILKGHQVVVPQTLQEDILSQLHGMSHQGIEKTRLLAKKCVFWPNINRDIADEVGGCLTCNTYVNSQPPEPMWERELPSNPWEKLASDLFELRGKKYILVADYYSKFPIIRKISSESTECIISHLKNIFAEYGIANELYTDNGPCYSSVEFQNFARDYGFKHITSSPRYPQSNGFAEKMVATVKNTLKKCADTNQDATLALLYLRNTPISGKLPSPAELLYGRPIKTTLPMVQTCTPHNEDVKYELSQRQEYQKMYYDLQGTKELPPLNSGDPVMLQDALSMQWKPGTVVTPSKEPRSYVVQTTDGTRYRRNRKFLRKLAKPIIVPSEEPAEVPDTQTDVEPPPTQQDKDDEHEPRRSPREIKKPNRLICEM